MRPLLLLPVGLFLWAALFWTPVGVGAEELSFPRAVELAGNHCEILLLQGIDVKRAGFALQQARSRVGYSKGMNSAIDAERAAIGLCQVRDCRAVVNFTNACGAVAQSSDTYWAWGRDRTGEGAQRSALISCSRLGPGCRVVGFVCS